MAMYDWRSSRLPGVMGRPTYVIPCGDSLSGIALTSCGERKSATVFTGMDAR